MEWCSLSFCLPPSGKLIVEGSIHWVAVKEFKFKLLYCGNHIKSLCYI